jgi:hypothetical protein
MAQDGPHIALSRLWEYSKNRFLECSKDPTSLSVPAEERAHLATCEDCIAVLWMCRASALLEDVQNKLRERFIRTS